MKYEDLVLYMIELYIENEIDYIEQELAIQESTKNCEIYGSKEDLEYLENLTQEDLLKILDNILNNTDFYNYTDSIIQEYLYKYKNEKEVNNE